MIQYMVSETAAFETTIANTTTTATTTTGSWYIVQLDSDLNILSTKQAAYLGNDTNLLAPFVFDNAGMMYQLGWFKPDHFRH